MTREAIAMRASIDNQRRVETGKAGENDNNQDSKQIYEVKDE